MNRAGRNIYFAWAGRISLGEPHYYRVQTSYFLIELDDTQDNACKRSGIAPSARQWSTSASAIGRRQRRPLAP
jgi:hypothetical protein